MKICKIHRNAPELESLFKIKVQVMDYNLIKKDTPAKLVSCEFYKNLIKHLSCRIAPDNCFCILDLISGKNFLSEDTFVAGVIASTALH